MNNNRLQLLSARIRAFFVRLHESGKSHAESNSYSQYFNGWGFCILFVLALPLGAYFSPPFALMTAGTLATCVEYLTIAKPKMSFSAFFAIIQAILISASVTLYFYPPAVQFAVTAIWILFFLIALPFNTSEDKRESLWKYLLGSYTASLVLILLASYFNL